MKRSQMRQKLKAAAQPRLRSFSGDGAISALLVRAGTQMNCPLAPALLAW